LIENLTFALDAKAAEGITGMETWSEKDRLIIVDFLEQFKTAYALKRLDYISSIFADDALIIVGQILAKTKTIENQYELLPQIRYSRLTKAEYIKNLRSAFASKEYINIKFEESFVEKGTKGGDIYGINLAQRYFSSNYGDFGYLFLLVDLNNPDIPVIHVRTWQPQKDINGNVWTLGDF
jgi:hypothetical protein